MRTVHTVPVSGTALRRLGSNAWWSIKRIWRISRGLTLGLVGVTVVRGALPAGLALFARGMLNAVVALVNASETDIRSVVPWLLFGVVLTILEAVTPLIHTLFAQRLRDDINLAITAEILEHGARLELSFFEDSRLREMIERARNNPAEHFASFITALLNAVMTLLQTISLTAILTVIEPLLLVLLVPFVIPYLLYQWRLAEQHYRKEYVRTPRRRWTNYFTSLLTGQHAVPEVKMLGLAPLLIRQFRTLLRQFRDEDYKLYVRDFRGGAVFAVVATIAFFGLFVRVILKAVEGVLTVGDIAVFGGATSRLRSSVDKGIRDLSRAMEKTLFISDLKAFFSIEPLIPVTGGLEPATSRGEIVVDGVSFTYPGASIPTLRDVSLHIRPGEIVGLVGENGAGKTSLVKLLCRLYDPDDGRITFDDVDLRDLSLDWLHRRIAFVFQHFIRYEATAADNIAYGNWTELLHDRSQVERVARLAGVEELVEAMPEGYDTMLGRLFGQYDLSGGQWQKLVMARAMSRDASLLILDEPTAHLDARAEYELFRRFRDMAQGRTTLLISHRFSTLSLADRILVMQDGRIAESGTHQELLERAGNYAELYELHRLQMDRPMNP